MIVFVYFMEQQECNIGSEQPRVRNNRVIMVAVQNAIAKSSRV